MKSGVIVRQRDGVRFCDVDLHSIAEMWLDELERVSIRREGCPGFVEFIQFETARATLSGAEKTGEYIGWTNGEVEFVLGITKERHTFHPQSRCKGR